ncbi:polyprenyl synthetase family protein [Helcococcus kunzii]|uniref:polyprenyl synthetase family protein n=1 Tax=Helcococcus kunzii TaxID=40091 RepID=UPI001BB049B2|nr:polyprenyl synthetase family protein [Helcococcus kunzii]QUY64720.1 polyprenyl synthetase family protein [Helcococcus kunzii]QZO77129.1 polyprenyl synthetase family protein [Helcococcus kunzii]
MFDLYNDKKNDFDKIINNYFDKLDDFNEILNYSIEIGKRVRPIILLETFSMVSDDTDANIDIAEKFAIALEFIHNYSLIHDDLPSMDNDKYRRGRETIHYKYGEDYAILAGDALLNYAFELIFSVLEKNPSANLIKAGKYLANASGLDGMIRGQVSDIKDQIKNSDSLIEMYKNKTCRLLMAATTIPGYIANLPQEEINDLEKLGFYIGMAFQIQDDILDYEQDKKISKATYISYFGKEKAYQDMLEYSNNALSIIERYKKSKFLNKLIKELIYRKH